jgi:hypothetical protein
MQDAPDVRTFDASIPADVAAIVATSLARDRTHRFASAAAMLAAVCAIAPSEGEAPGSSAAQLTPPSAAAVRVSVPSAPTTVAWADTPLPPSRARRPGLLPVVAVGAALTGALLTIATVSALRPRDVHTTATPATPPSAVAAKEDASVAPPMPTPAPPASASTPPTRASGSAHAASLKPRPLPHLTPPPPAPTLDIQRDLP